MPLEPESLKTVGDLYTFVESAVHATGLILAIDAPYRPWARHIAAECKEVRWVYPAYPLSEQLRQHLTNFAHRPLPEKGFMLFRAGRVVAVVDVAAVGGSCRPDHLSVIVRHAFAPKSESRKYTRPPVAGAPSSDPYQVLGANEIDSNEEIKRKYKRMVMQYHPDRVTHLGVDLQSLAARKTTEINEAFAKIRRQRGF